MDEAALGAALALASGLAWAGLDAVRKRLGRGLSPVAVLFGISAAQVPVYGAVLLVGSGFGSGSGALGTLEMAFFGWTALAVAILIAANLLLIRALQLSPLSLTTPFLSFTPVATLLSGGLLLQQRPSGTGLAGTAVVVMGAWVLRGGPLRAIASEPGSRLALVVACLFALGNAVDRRAILQGSEIAYAALLTLLVTVVLAIPSGPRREVWARRQDLQWLAMGGVVMAVALLLQLFAFRFLFVAYADAAKRTGGNLVAVAFGAYFFGEGDWRRRLVGAGVMGAGVALILLG